VKLSRHPHPVDRPALPILMLAFLVVTVFGAVVMSTDEGPFPAGAAVLAVGAGASFLILLAIYWTAWVVRGHVLWLEERASSGDEPPAG
jgi:ABC-type dipeptide/oligopeptide/nickel transport system permease subunit